MTELSHGDSVAGVVIQLPTALAELASSKTVELAVAFPADVGDALDALAASFPLLERRLRDETGALRRYVNVYLGGVDVRSLSGLRTPVADGAVLQIVPSVAGG